MIGLGDNGSNGGGEAELSATPCSEWDAFENPTYPGSLWTKIRVIIRNNETGECRDHETVGILEDDGTLSTYIWEEGNFACDCNRSLFFDRAGYVDSDLHHECTEGRFSVNIVNPKSGKIVYQEFSPNVEGRDGTSGSRSGGAASRRSLS